MRVPGTSALVGQEGYDLGVGREACFGFQIRGARPATVQAATSEQGQTQPRSATVIVALT